MHAYRLFLFLRQTHLHLHDSSHALHPFQLQTPHWHLYVCVCVYIYIYMYIVYVDPAVCAGLFNCFARVSVHGMCAFLCLNLIWMYATRTHSCAGVHVWHVRRILLASRSFNVEPPGLRGRGGNSFCGELAAWPYCLGMASARALTFILRQECIKRYKNVRCPCTCPCNRHVKSNVYAYWRYSERWGSGCWLPLRRGRACISWMAQDCTS